MSNAKKLTSFGIILFLYQMSLSSCSSILRDYDLISQGISSQYQLNYGGETAYLDSMIENGTSYASTAFFVGNAQLPTILSDQNNKELTFYLDPKDYENEMYYLLWEVCAPKENQQAKHYSFALNESRLQLIASYSFNYPYRTLGLGKRKFFPHIPAEDYVQRGSAEGLIACRRYLLSAPSKLQADGKNTFEIRYKLNKIYVFTYFYENGFVKNYKKFF